MLFLSTRGNRPLFFLTQFKSTTTMAQISQYLIPSRFFLDLTLYFLLLFSKLFTFENGGTKFAKNTFRMLF
jgi:hypothetical protein